MAAVVIALSLAAALCFAAASVLQHQAASVTSAGKGTRGGLLLVLRLLMRPRWLAGIVADAAGYGLQVLALDNGPLALVQPLLAGGLLFALLFNVSTRGRGMRKRDWVAAGTTAAGLAVFVIVGAPKGSAQGPDDPAWGTFALLTAAAVAGIVVLSQRQGKAAKAALLAGAAGVAFALSAALTKQTLAEFHRGLGHMLVTGYPWGLIVVGGCGMVLVQTAFQAGPLAASLPTLTLTEPVFAALAGAVLFGEHLRGGAAGAIAVLGAVVGAASVVSLTRSPSAQPMLEPA